MNWYDYVKRYVWDDNRTPFFVPVAKLSQYQAEKESFLYTLFLVILFGFFTLFSAADVKAQGNLQSLFMAFYTFSLVCSAIYFRATMRLGAALYAVPAPVAAFLIIYTNGLAPEFGLADQFLIFGFCAAWLRYALRVTAIARAYPDMPEMPAMPENGEG